MVKHVNVKLKFDTPESGYIAKPFCPELSTVINVAKDVHPKLGEAKKQQAVLAALEKRGLTKDEWDTIQELAKRPFYTIDGTRKGEIIIPQRIFRSFLNHASMKCPKAIPSIKERGMTFIAVTVESHGKHGGAHFLTGQTEKDAIEFTRLVKLEESNQWTPATDLYIRDFEASARIGIEEEVITSEDLKKLTEWGGYWIGIGSARPQGFGRFTVTQWEAA